MLIDMGYKYTIHCRLMRFKNDESNDNHYIVGIAETVDKANKFCDDYRIANLGAELRIREIQTNEWIIPDFNPQDKSDWNPK